MQIAVRFKDGSKNLLQYDPSEEYSTEAMMQETKTYMEKEKGKPVAVVLVQVVNNSKAAEKLLA